MPRETKILRLLNPGEFQLLQQKWAAFVETVGTIAICHDLPPGWKLSDDHKYFTIEIDTDDFLAIKHSAPVANGDTNGQVPYPSEPISS
jgi:hypothetical protein